MKEIKAVLHPHMVEKVIRALRRIKPFPGVTLMEARGQGRGAGPDGAFAVTESDIDFRDKTVMVVICRDELTDAIVETISRAARTGRRGDGVILVSQAAEVIRIRSGERDESAV
jgi:nitrogen regulatory protein P-II 1